MTKKIKIVMNTVTKIEKEVIEDDTIVTDKEKPNIYEHLSILKTIKTTSSTSLILMKNTFT